MPRQLPTSYRVRKTPPSEPLLSGPSRTDRMKGEFRLVLQIFSSQRISKAVHEAYLEGTYRPELDGLRAVSILLVISWHMKNGVWD